ncbi:GTP-binding protein [Vampirovibrio sp.]|uniref:CobW family GTP-binding protein n=1 Tax=Vampirovibrio sp. TaxID=2717857 RepID=UPI003593980A
MTLNSDLPISSDKRIPVTILTGFLGSGKTTLMNRILSENHGKRIAVIENEFGEIGIDDALVINAEEEIFEMNNGCICCTVRGDLIRILGNLMRRKNQFDYILVETTGLADPAPVAQTFFVDDEIKALLRLDGIVTLVDAKHVWQHIDTSMECKEQIAFADVILLNKVDLVTPDELVQLEARIRAMNAMAKIYQTQDAAVEMEKILEVGGFALDRALTVRPTFLETEYPFEWAGLYELKPDYYQFQLEEGPDPTMNLMTLKVEGAGEEAIRAIQEEIAHRFSEPPLRVKPGEDTFKPAGQLLTLELAQPGSKKFNMRVEEPGTYALFTQHQPIEFAMNMVNSQNEGVDPTLELLFNPGHEHDNSVTSVGLEIAGELNSKLLNAWMGTLLREKGVDIFRMKGILNIQGEDRRFVFQGVHMLFDGQPDRPWNENESRTNQLVFIGRNLNRSELVQGFKACLAKAPQLASK